jgi:hypothetical protein
MAHSTVNLSKYLKAASLVFCFSTHVSITLAQDTDRIAQLEREISELKNRVTRLESPTVGSKSNTRTVPSGDGWKSIANWRSLKKGMSFDDVRAILGEPGRIQGGTLTYWTYPDRGSVTFYNDRLDGWTEPR